VYRFSTWIVCASLLVTAAHAQQSKNYKSQAEFQIYTAVTADFAANNFSKALTDLDSWKKDFPESDFADDRLLLYVQAYAGAKQPAKALEDARSLFARSDVETAVGGPANMVKLLYTAAIVIQQIPAPSNEDLELAAKCARQLLAYDKKPSGVADDAWAQARGQLQAAAKGVLLYVATLPGTQAMARNDCATAESAFTRALQDNPESSQAAWFLGTAELCLYKTQPEKASPAIYAFARAAAVDPVRGMVDPKWQQGTVEPFLVKVYEQYHGKDSEGLRQLKELAAQSPFPAAGFQVKSVTQIADEKQAEFEKSNPQLALWMKIKGALADTNGDQYFAQNLQGTEVQSLRGVLVEAKPACRPKELLVAVPLPDAAQPLQPEITLKLDKPLAGRPDANAEFHWTGDPIAFSRSPFMLTMEAEVAKIEGLTTMPCAAATKKK
jgi:hypothetical protein